MPWESGTVTLDDGSSYKARLYVNDKGEVLNVRIHSWDFPGRKGQLAYPYTYQEDQVQVEGNGLNSQIKTR